jgi:hypothetical protein
MAAKLEKTRTPGIYRRGGRYVFSYRVDGKQRWESCRTIDEARRLKAAHATDIERGKFEPRSRVILHEYAPEWVERNQGRGRRGFREGTRADYRRQIEQYICRYFPARLRLTEITSSAVARFPSIRCSPQHFRSTTRLQSGRMTRTPCSQRPTDRRSCQTMSSGECSSPLGRPQTFRGSASTPSVTPSCSPESRNAVQVQRWLGHHSAAFTLATYVHLLDGDLGEPLTIPQTTRNDAK